MYEVAGIKYNEKFQNENQTILSLIKSFEGLHNFSTKVVFSSAIYPRVENENTLLWDMCYWYIFRIYLGRV